jgi:Tfp pilus assembly pilus retraction ATPase PilT
MHTANAAESIYRILSFFDHHAQMSIRLVLSQVMRAVVSQRLVTRRDGAGLIAAAEVMVANGSVREAIAKGEIGRMHDIMEEGRDAWGMQTFDQALIGLCRAGLISTAEALKHSSSKGDMELQLSGVT